MALFQAARSSGRSAWEKAALETLDRSIRRPPATSGILDAELCHGAAGLAHIYNRAYQATGSESLRDAACTWFGRALEMRVPGQGVGGYSCFDLDSHGKYVLVDHPGFLTGAAGIGLALLAAILPVQPAWDRILLLSGPSDSL